MSNQQNQGRPRGSNNQYNRDVERAIELSNQQNEGRPRGNKNRYELDVDKAIEQSNLKQLEQ